MAYIKNLEQQLSLLSDENKALKKGMEEERATVKSLMNEVK